MKARSSRLVDDAMGFQFAGCSQVGNLSTNIMSGLPQGRPPPWRILSLGKSISALSEPHRRH